MGGSLERELGERRAGEAVSNYKLVTSFATGKLSGLLCLSTFKHSHAKVGTKDL